MENSSASSRRRGRICNRYGISTDPVVRTSTGRKLGRWLVESRHVDPKPNRATIYVPLKGNLLGSTKLGLERDYQPGVAIAGTQQQCVFVSICAVGAGIRLRKIEKRIGTDLLDRGTLKTVIATTHLVLLRISALASIVPVLLVWIALAVIEGLTARAIRRYRGGRESATTYHIAKRLTKPIVAWTGLIYLCSPLVIDVETVYIFLAIVIPATTYLTKSRFKKYL